MPKKLVGPLNVSDSFPSDQKPEHLIRRGAKFAERWTKPPKDLSSWGAWERRQSAIEDRMPELGLVAQFLNISYTLATYPIKALIRVRHQMQSTRQVRDMLYGPTSHDESSRGEG